MSIKRNFARPIAGGVQYALNTVPIYRGGSAPAPAPSAFVFSISDSSEVKKISSSGTTQWTFGDHTQGGLRVFADAAAETVFSSSKDDSVRATDLDNNLKWANTSAFSSDVNLLRGDGSGSVYAAVVNEYLSRVDDGSTSTQLDSLSNFATCGFIGPNGNIYVAVFGGTIEIVAPDGTQVDKFTSAADTVNGMSIDSSGNMYVALDNGDVQRINADKTVEWTYSTPNVKAHNAIFDSATGQVFAATTALHKIDATTGSGSSIYSPLQGQMRGLAIDSNGNVYVGLANDNSVRQLDKQGNEQWVNTDNTDEIVDLSAT